MERLASVVVLTIVTLGWVAGPARADGSAPAGNGKPGSAADDGRRSFGLQPAGPKGPDARAFYSYSVTPGAVVTDRMAVRNISDRPAKLTIYPADAFNTPEGGFDVGAKGVGSHDVGAWLRVRGTGSPFQIVVPARADIVVPISMKVPTNATPGDHAGGIVASLRTQAQSTDGSTVSVDQRVGIRVYTRVSGTLRPHLSVTQLRAAFHGSRTGIQGWVRATWVVRNDGNVILGGRMQLKVSGLGSSARALRVAALEPLLPGESHRVTARVEDVLRTGRLSATATVRPASLKGVVDPRLTPGSATVHLWAVPWLLLAIAILLAALGTAVWWRRRRSRRDGTPSAGVGGQLIRLPQSADAMPAMERPALRAAAARVAVSMLAVVSVLAGAVALGTPAQASGTEGLVSFLPASGTDVTPPWVVTDAPCPMQASNLVAVATGYGFPREGQVVVTNSTSWVRHDAPMVIGLGDSWRGFADVNSTDLQGRYDVTVTCVDRLMTTSFAKFTGVIHFTDPHHFSGPEVPAEVRDQVVAAEQGSAPSQGTAGSGSSGSAGSSAASGGDTSDSTGSDGSSGSDADTGSGGGTASGGDTAASGGGGSAGDAGGAATGGGATPAALGGSGEQSGAEPGGQEGAATVRATATSTSRGGGVLQLAGFGALGLLLLAGAVVMARRERSGR